MGRKACSSIISHSCQTDAGPHVLGLPVLIEETISSANERDNRAVIYPDISILCGQISDPKAHASSVIRFSFRLVNATLHKMALCVMAAVCQTQSFRPRSRSRKSLALALNASKVALQFQN